MKPPRDALHGWAAGWQLLAALAFLVVGSVGVFDTPADWAAAPRFWILFSALAVWYGVSIPLGRQRLHDSLLRSLIYFAAGWAIWAQLLALHPATYAFASIFFPLTYSRLPTRRAIVFALVATVLMFTRGTAWEIRFTSEALLSGGLAVVSSVMLALFIDAIIRQSEQRKQLILQLETAREGLAQAERQAGVVAERQRLAQQIHDSVAQGFVGIVTHLEAAETSLDAALPAAGHVAAAKASARASLAEARRLVWDLRPDLLSGEPLPVVLERQLRDWAGQSGIAAEQTVTGVPRRLDNVREAALVMATREGLSNVRAHARASRVRLTLSYMDDEVVLDLVDDGTGRRTGPADGGGFGLRALEERIRALGGRCVLESAAGEGTALTINLPLGSP